MTVLEILKWIGIVLLSLLLILLVLLLLVLFLPIKYSGEGTYNQEQRYAVARARWFWGLVRVKATFPQKPYLSVKIFWIELIKPKLSENLNETLEKEEKTLAEKVKEPTKEETPCEIEEEAKREENKAAELNASVDPPKTANENIVDEKEPILNKWIGIKEKIQYYIDVLHEKDTKDVIAHCKKRIVKILKSIRPRKLNFKGVVGFKTPDTTGYLYGGYCMISSYLGKNVILIPDFENEIIDVTGSFQGRITLFILAWNALRVYLDKRLMRLIAKLKKGGR